MFDTMYIGISGLVSYSRGLDVISNNLANMNTAGFKGSAQRFGDLFYRQQGFGGENPFGAPFQIGTGVYGLSTSINFRPGDVQSTGNPLDVAINGNGFLVTRDAEGVEQYTRAGQLNFDNQGFLVSTTSGRRVAGLNADGSLVDISINPIRVHVPVATTSIELAGTLSAGSEFTVQAIKVFDALGGEHSLSAVFRPRDATESATWDVQILDGTTEVGTGEIHFLGTIPDPASSSITFSYSPPDVPALTLTLSLQSSAQVLGSTTADLRVASQDGAPQGSLLNVGIDADGFLSATYSNGKTQKGAQLALARPASESALIQVGDGEFTLQDRTSLQIGKAGTGGFGTFAPGQVEGSNIDLADEFSNLIIMQRGYQASSRIVSTANELIQDLFDMRGKR